jgi:hypothetical protein
MILESHPKEISESSKGNGGIIQKKFPETTDEITKNNIVLFIK